MREIDYLTKLLYGIGAELSMTNEELALRVQ